MTASRMFAASLALTNASLAAAASLSQEMPGALPHGLSFGQGCQGSCNAEDAIGGMMKMTTTMMFDLRDLREAVGDRSRKPVWMQQLPERVLPDVAAFQVQAPGAMPLMDQLQPKAPSFPAQDVSAFTQTAHFAGGKAFANASQGVSSYYTVIFSPSFFFRPRRQ